MLKKNNKKENKKAELNRRPFHAVAMQMKNKARSCGKHYKGEAGLAHI